MILLLELMTLGGTQRSGSNPHQIYNVIWTISNLLTGVVANKTVLQGALKEAFPTLYVDLCDLVGNEWDPSDHDPSGDYGCQYINQREFTREFDIYVCPGHKVSPHCGGPAEDYCKSMGV